MFGQRLIWAVILVVSAAGLARADDISWDEGHGTPAWHEPGNWLGDDVPGSQDHAHVGDLFPGGGTVARLYGTSAFIRALTITNEVEVDTDQSELQVNGGPIIIDGPGPSIARLYASDRDPTRPAAETNLDSVDADSIELRDHSLLTLHDAVVEVDQGVLYIDENVGQLWGFGRIDLARTDGGLNLDNNGIIFVGYAAPPPPGQLLIQNDANVTGANGTVDLDGSISDSGTLAMFEGDLIVNAPLADSILNGRIRIWDGYGLTISDNWALGSNALLQFTDGGTVGGGDVTINGTATVETVDSGTGSFGNSNVIISGGTPSFQVDTGTLLQLGTSNTVTFSAADATFTGTGRLEGGHINIVNEATQIGADGTHDLILDMDGATGTRLWTLNADLAVDVADTEAGSDGFDGTLTINNDARFNIDQPGNFKMQGTFELNGATIDNPGAATGIAFNEVTAININSGVNNFALPVEFLDNSATFTVAPAAEVRLETATFRGGNFSGGGLLRLGSSTIQSDTVLAIDQLDLDYVAADHTLNARLTIDADSIETLSNDGFDGSFTINSTALDVNVSSGTFAMEGEFQLAQATIESTRDGNTMTLGDAATIHANTGVSRFVLPVEFVDGTTATTITDGAWLWFDRDVTFRGGTITGAGTLRAGPMVTVAAPTVIAVDTVDMDWGDWTIAANLTLDVSAIDSAGDGFDGLAIVHDSTFEVTSPWVLEGTVSLSSGTLAGAEITNDGWIQGHGTVAPDGLINNVMLVAVGGTLVIDNTANTYDLDGSADTGTLSAVLGNMHVLGDVSAFDGTVDVGAGREFYVDGSFDIRDFSGPGALNLGDGTVRTTGTLSQRGHLTVTGSTSTMESNVIYFRNGGTNTIDADLHLSGGVYVETGASFSGSGRLIIDDSFMRIEDGGIVGIGVRNQGTLQVGQSPGIAQIEQYAQTAAGSFEAEIDGLAVGTQYDQLQVTMQAALAGTLDVQVGGSYLQPDSVGELHNFVLLVASSVTGSFDEVVYDGTQLVPDFVVGSDGDFVDHVGSGLFRIVLYNPTDVRLLNYLALPGDANGDGTVDGQDFIIWNSHKFTSGTDWTTGDFTGDGVTDGQDFIVWNSYKFTSIPGLLQLVPEPSGSMLLLLAVVVVFRRQAADA